MTTGQAMLDAVHIMCVDIIAVMMTITPKIIASAAIMVGDTVVRTAKIL